MKYYKSVEKMNDDIQKAKASASMSNKDQKKKTIYKCGCSKQTCDYCKITNHTIENCYKKKYGIKNGKLKSKEDVIAINDNLNIIDTNITNKADFNKTVTSFEKMTKDLKITKVSDLYLLITKHTKTINYANINNLITEVIISICNCVGKVGDSNYLDLFTLLKCILINIGISKLMIKKKMYTKVII